ncbi:hypothetical protein [Blastococcus sp. TF02A-30]|uniref:hypothetical protein n=1 Tax=Blastococcus sp. TF02A-30 TaxID=2250580 RepID=UPI000DE96D9F|nr:hypothetical protein [Blastococcus sp. TF02A-30]RBY91213.1 hypothetical protein DQ241_06000 [Blastococcus sp. TF02A-30]
MKRALVAVGVVYVVVEMLARRFEANGWTGISTLDIAGAALDAALVVVLGLGVLLAGRLGMDRWARSMRRWHRRQALQDSPLWDEAEVIGVRSWRHGGHELPRTPVAPPPAAPAPPPSAGFTYVGPTYAADAPRTPAYREEPGPLL